MGFPIDSNVGADIVMGDRLLILLNSGAQYAFLMMFEE